MSAPVYVERVDLRVVLHLCEGQEECTFPVVGENRGNDVGLLLYCSELAEPGGLCCRNKCIHMYI